MAKLVLTDEELGFQVDEIDPLGFQEDLAFDFIPDEPAQPSPEESMARFNKSLEFSTDLELPLQDVELNFDDISLVESGAFDPSEPPAIQRPFVYQPGTPFNVSIDPRAAQVSMELRKRKVDAVLEYFRPEPEPETAEGVRKFRSTVEVRVAAAEQQAAIEQVASENKQRVILLTNADLHFVSDVMAENPGKFDRKLRLATEKEIRVRELAGALRSAPDNEQVALIATLRRTNVFNLQEWTSRLGINITERLAGARKGDFNAAIEAATRVLGEKNDADPVNVARIVDLGAGVMQVALEFWMTPGAKLATVPAKIRPLLQTGVKFAAQAALQAPGEEETVGERFGSVTESGLLGIGVGGAGKLLPRASIRVPALVGGIAGLTFARTGDIEQSLEAGATILGFEALRLMQSATRLTGAKIRNTFANKAVRAARAHNPDLARFSNKEVGQILQKQVENWSQAGLERTLGDKAKRAEADQALRLKKQGNPEAWNELIRRQGFGQAAREQAGIAPEGVPVATGEPVAALQPGTPPVTPPVAAKPAEPILAGVEEAKAQEAVQKLFHAERTVGDVKEGKVLGTFLTDDETAARGFAGDKGEVGVFSVKITNPLEIAPVNEEFPEAFTPDEFKEAINKAGVEFDADIDGDTFSEILDDAGLPLIKAIKKAGFDALVFPDVQGNRNFETTLIFDKKSITKAQPPAKPSPVAAKAQEATAKPEGAVALVRIQDGEPQVKFPEDTEFGPLTEAFGKKSIAEVISRLEKLPANKGIVFEAAKPAIPLEAKPPPEFTLQDIRELPKKTTKAQTEVFEQQTAQPIDRTSETALSETETRVSLVKAMSPKAQDEIETQSVAKVRDRISFKKPKVAIRKRFKDLLFKTDKAFRDEFAGLRRVVEAADVGDLAPADDPVQLAVAFTQKASARTRGFVLESTTDLAGNRKSKGLKQIFAPIIKDGGKAKFEEFVTYLVAARDINLQKRNIETGIDPVASRLTFDALDSPEFAQAAREITEWNQKGIDLLVESGRITKESGDAIKLANPIYAPFFREFAEEEVGVTTRKGKKFVPKKLKGSKRKIVDPVEGMIQQMQATIESAQRATIERSIANLATKNPEALEDFIKPTRPPVVPTKFTVKEIQAELEEIGIDFTGVVKEDLNELLTVFRPSAFPATQGVIKLKVDGKNKFFKAEKELLEVLDGVEVYKLGPFWDIVAGKPTRLLKLGATGLNPAFGLIRNPTRDILTFTVTSEFAKAGPFSAVSGILKDVKTKASGIAENFGFNSFEKSSDVTKFAALGGEMSGFITQDRAGTRHIQHEMLASNGVRYTVNTFRHPLDALRSLIGITEIGTRVGEFSAALKEGERLYGKGSLSASVFAVNAAQDVTTNFTRHGQIGKQINQIIPFFNVAIQGPDKIIRSFKDRPFKSTVAAVSALTIPAIFFWWRNKDKPWYQNMTAHEKANYIHFESPDDEDVIFRFPVPFELGHVFQAIPVAFLDAVHNNNPEEVKDILEATLNTANPLDWPSLIGPIIDIKANEDFAGRPIVSRANEGKLPADQFGPNTTELMKVIGQTINMSPSQIEHLTNSYTGGIYNRVARILESNDVEKQPADMPVIGTIFVRDPFAPRRQVQEFYTERKLLNQKFQSGTITLQEASRRIAINNFATVLSVSFDALREAKTVERRKKIWSDIGRIISFTDTVAPKRNREAQIPKE